MTMTNPIPVWLYGHMIGTLTAGAGQGAQFHWSFPADLPWDVNSRILSARIPLGSDPSPEIADSFFGALLPEGQWRNNLAREIGCADTDTVAMLAKVGRDTIGALSIGDPFEPHESEILTQSEVAETIRTSSGYFLAGGGSSALPGFQQKIALTKTPEGWTKGHGNVPSTHILKPEPSAENVDAHRLWLAESYMLALSRHMNLTTFNSEVIDFSGTRALVIERYDRKVQPDGSVQRLHQEDFSQALGLPWDANAKFEASNPGAQHKLMAALLDTTATAFGDEFAQRKQLLSYVTFNVAIGNTDAHTKNYSLIHTESGRVKLAPLYDLTPLSFNYEGRQELALYVDDRKIYTDVTRTNLANEGVSWGIPRTEAELVVQQTLEKLDLALQEVPGPESIHEDINGFIRERVDVLLSDSESARESSQNIPPSIRAAQGKLGPAYPRLSE